MKLNTLTCALAFAAILSTSANASTPEMIDSQGTINGITFVGVDADGNKTDTVTFVVNGTNAENGADGKIVNFDSHAAMLTAVANLQALNPNVRYGWVNGQEQVIAARAAFNYDPSIAKTIVGNDNISGKMALIGKQLGFDQVATTPAEHAATAAPVYAQALFEIGALSAELS